MFEGEGKKGLFVKGVGEEASAMARGSLILVHYYSVNTGGKRGKKKEPAIGKEIQYLLQEPSRKRIGLSPYEYSIETERGGKKGKQNLRGGSLSLKRPYTLVKRGGVNGFVFRKIRRGWGLN